MKVYTRRGDGGETDLVGEGRVGKDSARVSAYGDVDELNACIGLYAAVTDQGELAAKAQRVQSTLFDLGSQLATPDANRRAKSGLPEIEAEVISALEVEIDGFEGELPPLTRFILPGGSPAAAALHHARTVCRRAERSVVALSRKEIVEAEAIGLLNRLSDWLFVLARLENKRAGVPDVEWRGRGES
ncbi:MAG: cob(I)yrinic acid a,c-diamide adenosyltransferase [Myxococcota bacterium]